MTLLSGGRNGQITGKLFPKGERKIDLKGLRLH